MLTPEQLEAVSNDISRIYEQTETACIEAIVKRLSMNKNITSYTAWQLRKLNDAGMLQKELISVISKQSKRSLSEVKRLVESAIKKSYANDLSGKSEVEFAESLEKALSSIAFQNTVKKAVTNIVQTLNVTNTKALQSSLTIYRNAVDSMYYKVATGLYDFDKAFNEAVKEIGSKGVQIQSRNDSVPDFTSEQLWEKDGSLYTTYQTGVIYPVDSSIRRDVITTLNQMTIEQTLQYCYDNGIDLVQTSQHYGARPTHEVWQGQIFSLTGTGGYPDFKSSTRYGEVDGLGGINCRHSIKPFHEGDPLPDKIDKATNDKVYQEQTKQRAYENSIRKLKREQISFRTADNRLEAEKVQARLNRVQANYKQFLNDTGRRRETIMDSISGYHPIKIKGSN